MVPFQPDGRLARDQLQVPEPESQDLLRRLAAFEPGSIAGFGTDDQQLLLLDRLVNALPKAGLFATSVVARGCSRGRVYVYDRSGELVWTDVHRRYVQLVADLAGVAVENDLMLQEADAMSGLIVSSVSVLRSSSVAARSLSRH